MVDLVVLLALPETIVVFFATTCLGPLSTVYSHVVNEYFGVRQRVGGMATRLMAHSLSYLHLIDSKDDSGEWGISQRRMLERMKVCLKHDSQFNDCELEQLVQFCFESVHQYKGHEHHNSLIKQIMADKGNAETYSGLVFEEEFGQAMRNNETVTFEDFAPLFLSRRKLGFLEILFTPTYLHKIREKHRVVSDEKDGEH